MTPLDEMKNARYLGLVEVRSCIHGKGLFAMIDLPLPTMIVEIKGVVFETAPTNPSTPYALRIGQNCYWDECPPESDLYWTNFIDHDNYPNSVFAFSLDKKTAWLLTTKPVKKGEELFIKYDDYYGENRTTFLC
ncbi:MAG: SET domain-containing protein-lysine N-methyltransferase [Nitrososphaerota archaeon]|jgi:hypothetical protein|nr:SET domain-containing protein-lysine N-methyltransferase [Nitrososphaerota archaeon]MDG6923845.1 SET domain-containing protein-lysine N-methyltransferase [Nitrososphaerota archaeon]